MFLRTLHTTRYEYSQPVNFAPHAMYLRPRESSHLRLHRFELTLSPDGRRVAASDAEDNALEWVYFPAGMSAETLELRSESLVETLHENPFDFFVSPHAFNFPFAYTEPERHVLSPYLATLPGSDPDQLQRWCREHMPAPPTETVGFVLALNTAVQRSLTYSVREEAGIQQAAHTIATGGGSCRDYAVLFMALSRSRGIATRFVSGYLYEPPRPGSTQAAASLHAWAEVYLPGAGWRGVDPTHGIFCDEHFVPLAHSAIAENVNPVQGNFYGSGVTARMTSTVSIQAT